VWYSTRRDKIIEQQNTKKNKRRKINEEK